MKSPLTYRLKRRGFTLIEILIVAALISLFAGLATFGVQQMLKNAKLKAVIGETRQVGSALIFAHQDIGFYPKIGFMTYTKDLINTRYGWGEIDSMGLALSQTKGTFTYDRWSGPYFAASPARNQISARFKSIVTMSIPPYRPDVDDIPWPADQWGNPYVLYLLRYDVATDHWKFIETLGQEPDFWGAVVSYGPDGVPGSPGGSYDIDALRALRLFHQPGGEKSSTFQALEPTEYTQPMAEAYSRTSGDGIGIVDPGSDDLVYNIN